MCGVPYTALPFATSMSLTSGKPMIMRRKEAKDYGTKKMVEGVYKKGDKCLIVEDVVTSGASVNETSASLREEGLVITDAVVLLDREQGGPERIAADGVKLRAALTVTKFIAVLEKLNKLDAATCAKVREFVAANRFAPVAPEKALPTKTTAQMTYSERAYVFFAVQSRMLQLSVDLQAPLSPTSCACLPTRAMCQCLRQSPSSLPWRQ